MTKKIPSHDKNLFISREILNESRDNSDSNLNHVEYVYITNKKSFLYYCTKSQLLFRHLHSWHD